MSSLNTEMTYPDGWQDEDADYVRNAAATVFRLATLLISAKTAVPDGPRTKALEQEKQYLESMFSTLGFIQAMTDCDDRKALLTSLCDKSCCTHGWASTYMLESRPRPQTRDTTAEERRAQLQEAADERDEQDAHNTRAFGDGAKEDEDCGSADSNVSTSDRESVASDSSEGSVNQMPRGSVNPHENEDGADTPQYHLTPCMLQSSLFRDDSDKFNFHLDPAEQYFKQLPGGRAEAIQIFEDAYPGLWRDKADFKTFSVIPRGQPPLLDPRADLD